MSLIVLITVGGVLLLGLDQLNSLFLIDRSIHTNTYTHIHTLHIITPHSSLVFARRT